jgi:hypothetical protein
MVGRSPARYSPNYSKQMLPPPESAVILIWADEYEGTADYVFGRIGNSRTLRYNFNFWRSAAGFLYAGHGVEIQDWIKGLDFSIFDRIAPADRDVPCASSRAWDSSRRRDTSP